MSCNAWNHSPTCPCAFRGGNGYGGGGRGESRGSFTAVAVDPGPCGWSRQHDGRTVASYVNLNARCPECNAPVIFYRSPYDGRVFFDPPLGPPWPKHWCTDSGRWRSATKRPPVPNAPLALRTGPYYVAPARQAYASTPREPGWEPITSSRIHVSRGRKVLSGDIKNRFNELSSIDPVSFDYDGPIWAREREDAPGVFQVSALLSGLEDTKPQNFSAVEKRLLPLGRDILAALADDDAEALAAAGRFMLYQRYELAPAIVYLNRAYAKEASDVAIDLAVATLFATADKGAANTTPR
jgi:hypothetical protein